MRARTAALASLAILLATLATAEARTKAFKLEAPPPELVGKTRANVVATFGSAQQLVIGSAAHAVCGRTCDTILVYDAPADDEKETPARADVMLFDDHVRAIRWTFPGNRNRALAFPMLDSFFPSSADLVDELAVVATAQPFSAQGTHDFYQRTVEWNCGGWKCSAWVFCPYVSTRFGTRPASLHEYRVVELTVGPEPVRNDWRLRAWVGTAEMSLTGDLGRPDDEIRDGSQRAVVYGPLTKRSLDFASEVTTLQIVDSKIVAARTVYQGSPANPLSYPKTSILPEHGAVETAHAEPIDGDENSHGFHRRTWEWDDAGVRWKAQLSCDPYPGYSVSKAAWVTYADTLGCRVTEIDRTASPGNPPIAVDGTNGRFDVGVMKELNLTKAIALVPPRYPEFARETGIMGKVVMDIVIAPDGKVTRIVPERADPMFVDAAIAAVARWRYEPVVRDGQPISWSRQITLVFRLH